MVDSDSSVGTITLRRDGKDVEASLLPSLLWESEDGDVARELNLAMRLEDAHHSPANGDSGLHYLNLMAKYFFATAKPVTSSGQGEDYPAGATVTAETVAKTAGRQSPEPPSVKHRKSLTPPSVKHGGWQGGVEFILPERFLPMKPPGTWPRHSVDAAVHTIQDDYKVRFVGAYQLRNLSLDAEEFGDWAVHDQFPDLIPKDEIWIDDRVNHDDRSAFFDAAMAYLLARKKGKDIDEAYKIAEDCEKTERERRTGQHYYGRHSHEPPPPGLYVFQIGDYDGHQVWLVDGEVVRNTYKTDFVESGQSIIYDFIPDKQIWVESTVDEDERKFLILHEAVEYKLMFQGWSYDSAHAEASRQEFAARKASAVPPKVSISPFHKRFSALGKSNMCHDPNTGKFALCAEMPEADVVGGDNASPRVKKRHLQNRNQPHHRDVGKSPLRFRKLPQESWSYTYFDLPGDLSLKIREFAEQIPEEDVVKFESELHLTNYFGLHGNDPAPLEKLAGSGPIICTLAGTSTFRQEEQDVLKIDVQGEDLHRIHKAVGDLMSHTDTHPDYKPHITIAYLKPGASSKHLGDQRFRGEKVVFTELVFKSPDGRMAHIQLLPPVGGKPSFGGERKSIDASGHEHGTNPGAQVQNAGQFTGHGGGASAEEQPSQQQERVQPKPPQAPASPVAASREAEAGLERPLPALPPLKSVKELYALAKNGPPEEVEHAFLDAMRRGRPELAEIVFEPMVSRIGNIVIGSLVKKGFKVQDAEDVAQEALVAVFTHAKDIPDGGVTNFAKTVARNKLTDKFRSESASARRAQEAYGGEESRETPIQEVISKEDRERVDETVNAMPEQMQAVFTMTYDENMTQRDIAAKLNITKYQVERDFAVALSRVRRALGVEDIE